MMDHDQYLKLKDNFWTIAYKELFSESKNIGLVFISLLTFLAGRFTMSDNEWIRNISNIVSIILGALFFIFVVWGLYKFITNIIDKQSLEENE